MGKVGQRNLPSHDASKRARLNGADMAALSASDGQQVVPELISQLCWFRRSHAPVSMSSSVPKACCSRFEALDGDTDPFAAAIGETESAIAGDILYVPAITSSLRSLGLQGCA